QLRTCFAQKVCQGARGPCKLRAGVVVPEWLRITSMFYPPRFFSLNGPAHHAQDVHSFSRTTDTLQTPTIRDAVEEQMESAPLAARFSYALACLICLTLVSYCFGKFACFPNEDRQVTQFSAALRTYHLSLKSLARMPLIRYYLLAVYFWGI